MSKETKSEKAAAEIALKEYDFARKLDFIKNEYQKRVERLGTKAMQDDVTGKANIQSQAQISDARNQINSELSAQGVDPSSGRSASTMTGLQAASGDTIGRSQAESAFALDSANLEGMNNRIAMALGEKTKAVAGLQDIAQGANQLARERAFSKFNERAATNQALGSVAGMGAGLYYNHKLNQ